MKKHLPRLLFFIPLFFLFFTAKAQTTGSLKAAILEEKTKQPVEYAAITLVSTKDSTLRLGALSGKDGKFLLKDIQLGDYALKISFVGMESLKLAVNLSAARPDADLGTLYLKEDGILLKEVAVKGEVIPVKVKKDTVEYNADAYKVQPNASTEELLKKLPGVEVDRDGNITVQGQKVSRLTVDGKDFFGTDPKTATKNLPADAIAKIQVIDSKTQEAKATGIDDGQREKVLNLTIKEDKKNGWFGNATAFGGTTDRYSGYLSANHFNKDLQFAVLGMTNNTSNNSFGYDDLNSFSGGNIGNIFAPPAGGSFSINVNNGRTTIGGSGVFDNSGKGLVTTHSGGINYSNRFGKKKNLELSSSYFTYFSDGNANRLASIQNLDQSGVLRTNESSVNLSDNQAHRLNLRLFYKPDTLTDITFRPNAILNRTANNITNTFSSAFENGGLSNDGNQHYDQSTWTPSLFGEFSVLRRLGPKKGSVSLRLNTTYNAFNADWINRSLLNEYSGSGSSQTDLNQDTEQENSSRSYTVNGNYARPLNDIWSANVTYTWQTNRSEADQLTQEYNPITDRYEIVVPSLTNRFNTTSYIHAGRLGFIYNKGSWNLNFGAGLQQSGLDGRSFNSSNVQFSGIEKSYLNILPRFSASYRSKTNQTVQINYNANVFMPSSNDLQPVQNNTNPLYQREGNPGLEARKSHRMSLNFNTFDTKNDKFWNGYFLFNYTFDDISNSIRYANGVQYVKPVNVDGNYYTQAGSYMSVKTGVKGMRSFVGINIYAEHRSGFINDERNITNRFNINPNFNISYDIENKLNVSWYTYSGFNRVKNSLSSAPDNRYVNYGTTVAFSYEIFKNFRIDSQLEYRGNTGRADGFNVHQYLLNAGLEKYMMNRKLTLALKGFDLLKQNNNFERNILNNRIEDIRFNNITRYFYLSLGYKITKAGATQENRNPRNTVN